jgi:hypothetical protein
MRKKYEKSWFGGKDEENRVDSILCTFSVMGKSIKTEFPVSENHGFG